MIIEKTLNLLISLSISGSILFGIWLIGRHFLKKRGARRFQYYLLLLVLLRFIFPFSPNKSILGTIFSSIESSPFYEIIYGSKEVRNPSVIIGDNVIFKDNIIMGSKDTPFAPYIVYIWLAIAVCLIVQKITKYQSFAKYIKADWQSVDNPDVLDLLSEICEDKKITTPIDIYTTPLVSSPLLLGVRKNYIVLPHENMTQEQLYSILSHEITHYQNKDILYKWFMQFIVCIHWFNPVVYFIEKTMNRECEYACDEATTRYFSKEECYNYGTTLIEMTNNPGTYNEKVASVTLYENTKEIKNRLDAIITSQTHTQPKRSTALLSITVLMFSAIILGAYTPTPSKGTPDQNKLNESITNTSDSKPLGRPFS